MRLMHAMLRVKNLERSIAFFDLLGLAEHRRVDHPSGRYTLCYLRERSGASDFEIELTYNWDHTGDYTVGNSFGHIAFEVDDINVACDMLAGQGAVIARPPRDGHMAFVKTPDGVSIELLQRGGAIAPRAPYTSLPNQGSW
ncbi:MAG TPA: VOC family protein [Acidiferrobacteraceae bacterium]|nr:VOC family protein [Acidiferrobacteraceae bacterium]